MAPADDRRRPRAILLDLDDTLVDHSGIPESLVRACELIAHAVEGLDADQLLHANSEIWAEYWPQVEESCWIGEMDGYAVSLEAWRRTLHACGCADEETARSAFEQHLQLARQAYRLYADVPDFLTAAALEQLGLAVVTNGPSDVQRDKLQVLDLESAFHAVVISGELGIAKPDPAPFLTAAEQLGTDPRDVWHIGDSLTTDVGGARDAGIVAVWLNRRETDPGKGGPVPDLVVRSLSAVTDLVRRWA